MREKERQVLHLKCYQLTLPRLGYVISPSEMSNWQRRDDLRSCLLAFHFVLTSPCLSCHGIFASVNWSSSRPPLLNLSPSRTGDPVRWLSIDPSHQVQQQDETTKSLSPRNFSLSLSLSHHHKLKANFEAFGCEF